VRRPLFVLAVVAVSTFVLTPSAPSAPWTSTYRIDHVTVGDTVVLRNGQRVRLVQIDTPEVFFGDRVLRAAGVGELRAAPSPHLVFAAHWPS